MAETNGKPATIPVQAEREPYRPTASTKNVQDAVIRSLSNIVETGAYEASRFVILFERYDDDKPIAGRYEHLVDAAECLETALTHLGQLRTIVANRMSCEPLWKGENQHDRW